MGRAKIQIKKIEDNTNRHVTFCKRRRGLFKKARELSILCDADVALAVVSSTGRVFHYASSKNMEKILHEADKLRERHGINAALPWPQLINDHLNSAKEHTPGNCSMAQSSSGDTYDNLRSQVEKLQMELRLRNGDVKDMCNIKELVELEAKMERALQKVNRRRFEVSCNELEMLKKKLEMDNNELRRQGQHLQDEGDSWLQEN